MSQNEEELNKGFVCIYQVITPQDRMHTPRKVDRKVEMIGEVNLVFPSYRVGRVGKIQTSEPIEYRVYEYLQIVLQVNDLRT